MSGTEFHREKRQEVAGNPKTDVPTVNVSINVEKPTEQPAPTLTTSQTRLDEDTLRDFDKQNKDIETRNFPTESTKTNVSNEESLTEKAKNVASDTYDKGKAKVDEKTSMTSMIKNARYCLEDFMNPKLNIEKQIPSRILSNAFGLLFLTEYKGSFGVGSSMGTGLIIARKHDRQGWTGPCAIGMGGLSIGFQAGVQKIEHIIVLRDEQVLSTFASKGQLKLGMDASFAIGPLGRDAQVAVNVNDKDYAPIYSYSMSKGLHLGASLEGQVIMIRDDCNEEYYGKKVSAKDILFGNVDSLENDNLYLSLTRLIEEYTQKQGKLSQHLFSTEDDRRQYEDEYWGKSQKPHVDLNENEQTRKQLPINQGNENMYPKRSDWEKPQMTQNVNINENEQKLKHEKKEEISTKAENVFPWEKEAPQVTSLNENKQRRRDDNLEKSIDKQEIPRTNKKDFIPERDETLKKEVISDTNRQQMKEVDKRERISMDRLLRHACFNLENFMNPKLDAEKQIPVTLLNNCCGLLFLTELKGGLGIGGSTGVGFIITRKSNEEFSQPCAIGMGGVSVGFQIGGQKTEHILVFRDEQILKTFINKGEFNFGGDVSFSVGPLGRDIDTPLNASDKGYAAIYSYSMSNGAYVGLTMESQKLKILDDWNEDYFGKKIKAGHILFGNIKPQSMAQHNSYQNLVNLIKEYTKNKGKLTNDIFWNEKDRKEEECCWTSDNNSLEQKCSETSDIPEKEDISSMNRLLSHAYRALENFVSPNLAVEKKIPIAILKNAAAIIFLTEIKAGLVVGASIGRGFILVRRKDTEGWTGPCAISLGGMSIGWLAGAEKTDHIIVFRDSNVLQTFLSQGQLKFGGDLSFAVGPLGRDANVGVSVNDKGYAPIYSYSSSKGAYMGASLEGHLITIRNDSNEQYYGTEIKAIDILHGLVESPKDNDYKSLCELLDQYISSSQSQNYSKETKVINDSNVTHVVTDVHKEETVHKNDEKNKLL